MKERTTPKRRIQLARRNKAKQLLSSSVLPLFLLALICITPNARADSPPQISVPVALAPTQRDTPIELVALTLDADISESNGHTFVNGESSFKLHNTDPLNDLQVSVGFPAWAGDPYTFDPARLGTFAVNVDGVKVKTLTPARADLKIGGTLRAVDWYTFTLTIAGDEKKTVSYNFQQDLGDSAMPQFNYGLLPATDWKGSIGSARLTLRFPEATTLEQIVAYDPPNPDFDGTSLTWHFTTKEPTANPSLTLLRPSTWNDLNAKRRAAQQNPNDANTRTVFGNLLRQLASLDSPRRDSFYMQAIAELETAVRLDSNNRSARQSLGALYEARAGAAAGPRQVGYVQLAVAQWEALAASDANVRKQLAEDYFYLGLDAQTRGDFANAATFFDKASALAPSGAGPLFRPEYAAAQRRSLNIAWARALLDQNDPANAMLKARATLGDKFMASVTPPLFFVTHAEVATSSKTRAMTFVLTPSASAVELQNAVSGVVAALRAAGADANMTVDGSTTVFSIILTFEDPNDLRAQLNALAQTLPDRADWALVRAALSPGRLEWNETDDLFTHTTRYGEEVDLSGACNAFTAQLNETFKNLAPLETIAPNDDEAQLKRALLKYAQRGWQNALSLGQVVYSAGAEEARVDACAAQTLAWSSSRWRPERVTIVVAFVELVGIGVLVLRWRGKRRIVQ